MRARPAVAFLPLLLALVAAGAVGPSALVAEEEIPKLEQHPLTDAKPGEWIRWKNVAAGETTMMMLRVLGVKPAEKKVFIDVWQTSDDGTELKVRKMQGKWETVAEFKPTDSQEFKRDEMVWLEVEGKRLACRHIKIVEQINPPMPAPVRTREVWYSNDALGHGKVQELIDNPVTVRSAVAWGTMSEEDLAKARKEYKLDEPEKPAGS